MKRGSTGRYEVTSVGGETVRARRVDISFPAAEAGMDVLVELGVARELTGKKRNRVFVYDRYLATLTEGMEGAP
jgi:hypothetical protein